MAVTPKRQGGGASTSGSTLCPMVECWVWGGGGATKDFPTKRGFQHNPMGGRGGREPRASPAPLRSALPPGCHCVGTPSLTGRMLRGRWGGGGGRPQPLALAAPAGGRVAPSSCACTPELGTPGSHPRGHGGRPPGLPSHGTSAAGHPRSESHDRPTDCRGRGGGGMGGLSTPGGGGGRYSPSGWTTSPQKKGSIDGPLKNPTETDPQTRSAKLR